MKISPRTKPENTVDFETLNPGDAFLHQGGVWMKEEGESQTGINLATGDYQHDMCGDIVVPVDATLTWKRKKVTAKKK